MPTITSSQWQALRERFLHRYPDFVDFSEPGAEFAKNELIYKRQLLDRFEERDLRGTIPQLVGEGKGRDALRALQRVNFKNLIPTPYFWSIQFGETDHQICMVLDGLLKTVAHPYTGPRTLLPLLDATVEAGARPDWYVTSILWIFRPKDYFPVAITKMREFAVKLGVEIGSRGRLSTERYPPLREFVLGFGEFMADWKPRDMMDIQSVVWDMAHRHADEKRPQTEIVGLSHVEAEAAAVDDRRYTLEDAARDLFMPPGELENILTQLRRRKNIVLQGPPGVGKTFIAKRIAYLMMGEVNPSRVKMVQFHQSYSYEDFIQGFRPTEDGRFRLRYGHFYDFCKRAEADEDNDYFFIIDEINRGNLSKIFGELLMLLEHDKRGEQFSVGLAYSRGDDDEPEEFFVPENVYVIGTMNTADKSLALVDYAMRRRFAFISLRPQFGELYRQWMISECEAPADFLTAMIGGIVAMNEEITKDRQLGAGCCIGHSFFTPDRENPPSDWPTWLADVLKSEVQPLLQEYWPDDPSRAEEAIQALLF